jgi:D-isomer specific 2-hydroxyacid dehydrogenase, catalytic domain
MSTCLIVQPIHPVGEELLRAAGLTPRVASRADMATVAPQACEAISIITRSAGLSAQAMDAAPSLRVIGSHGVGVNAIAVEHATALGFPVVNTPDANRASVADHTIALMLAAAKRIVGADAATRRVDFDFKYRNALSDISGKVLGVASALAASAAKLRPIRLDKLGRRASQRFLARARDMRGDDDIVEREQRMIAGEHADGRDQSGGVGPPAALARLVTAVALDLRRSQFRGGALRFFQIQCHQLRRLPKFVGFERVDDREMLAHPDPDAPPVLVATIFHQPAQAVLPLHGLDEEAVVGERCDGIVTLGVVCAARMRSSAAGLIRKLLSRMPLGPSMRRRS